MHAVGVPTCRGPRCTANRSVCAAVDVVIWMHFQTARPQSTKYELETEACHGKALKGVLRPKMQVLVAVFQPLLGGFVDGTKWKRSLVIRLPLVRDLTLELFRVFLGM